MTIHRIRTEAEYRATRKEISALVDADPDLGTPAGDRLNALVSQAQDYELLCVPVDAGLVDRYRQVVNALPAHGCRPPVEVRPDWYY